MLVLNVNLDTTVLQKLDEYSDKHNLSKEKIAETAIVQYFAELEEDAHDYQLAKKAWDDFIVSGEKALSSEEMWNSIT